ncbi:30S ribosomal protein S4e [Candidatus Bathyarchaeota archaeon]|nr:30S ribosomal protein S4e [Candidatus Bathyarchaeota archaeon]
MGKISGSKHLKRLAAPELWNIPRKAFRWVVKPSPGPYPTDGCIPLQILIRDFFGLAHKAKEVKFILNKGYIKVDGRIVRDRGFPVGLMDALYIEKLNKSYRILPSSKGLIPHPIPPEESQFKLRKIVGKSTIKGGCIQLNMHDGYNMIIQVSDPRNPVEDQYKVHDVLKMDICKPLILDHFKLEKGVYVLITGGHNIGKFGRLVEVVPGSLTSKASAVVEMKDGSKISTILDYVFPVGYNKPCISLPT